MCLEIGRSVLVHGLIRHRRPPVHRRNGILRTPPRRRLRSEQFRQPLHKRPPLANEILFPRHTVLNGPPSIRSTSPGAALRASPFQIWRAVPFVLDELNESLVKLHHPAPFRERNWRLPTTR